MSINPKFYARVFSHARETNGALTFILEYISISTPYRSGKMSTVLALIINENQMTNALKDALAIHLTAKYGQIFIDRDIVGLAV